MSIFLMILKILLFTIIALLGLLLLVLLIVLFVPIHYKLAGVFNEKVKAGEFGFRWLILHGKGSYDKENGLKLRAKILFFTVFSNDKEKTKKSKGKEKDPESDVKDKKSKKNKKSKNKKLDNLNDENDPLLDDNITLDLEKAMEDSSLSEESYRHTETESAVRKSGEKTIGLIKNADISEPGKTTDITLATDLKKDDTVIDLSLDNSTKQAEENFVDKAFNKAGEFLDKIKNKAETIEKKQDHFDQFINKDFTKRTIKNAMKFIAKTLKSIGPRRGYAYIKMGLKSAADTGIWLGRIAAFYPIYGKWLKIEPDFYNKVFNLDMKCRGHIMIGPTAFRGLFLYLKKDTKRTLSLLKKI